ncbi:hypothetical protein K435DRAFT_782900 [Dendrothele bispora CBS 962.96]|uniref:Amidohydrolase-related domain-containing protein n=1 Tax=Dendrothele bispora (strain CBS 962.96) TaxID=1314807 RepID=A0A4S8LC12_DENBC|nr:hypothetical protein K435DRAFT_782900 [Dendrothele bispora CBS 962.96]
MTQWTNPQFSPDDCTGSTVSSLPNAELLFMSASASPFPTQTHAGVEKTNTRVKIFAGKLFDPLTLEFLPSQCITVCKDTGIILQVEEFNPEDVESTLLTPSSESNLDVIDLRHLTVLPGFVDVHVHMFLHSYGETSWDDQLTKESLAERTIRATVHARKTLMAGFTTVRDLGTEGAEDADISLRKCLSGPNPLIPGPRYFCSNRAIVATGSYGPRSVIHMNQEGVEGITGAEAADGVDACVAAVRRQIGTGADWIKIYAEYRFRSRASPVSSRTASRSIPTFHRDELRVMIDTAHACGVKVAAHSSLTSFQNLLSLGVDSIEHGSQPQAKSPSDKDLRDLMQKFADSKKTTWVPTLSVLYKMVEFRGGKDDYTNATWEEAQRLFKAALDVGMENIACGGDTGAFSHGENALEMKLMVRLGAEWKKVLRWATLSGWELIRPMDWEEYDSLDTGVAGDGEGRVRIAVGDHDVKFGRIVPGWAADLVGLKGDIEQDFEGTVDGVDFVMKRGKIYKMDGREVV